MTRDDIIRLARKDWIKTLCPEIADWQVDLIVERIDLAAAAERERMKSEGWRQCAEGQRTTQYCGQLEDAVNAERERYEREIRALQFQVDELKRKCRDLRLRGESK